MCVCMLHTYFFRMGTWEINFLGPCIFKYYFVLILLMVCHLVFLGCKEYDQILDNPSTNQFIERIVVTSEIFRMFEKWGRQQRRTKGAQKPITCWSFNAGTSLHVPILSSCFCTLIYWLMYQWLAFFFPRTSSVSLRLMVLVFSPFRIKGLYSLIVYFYSYCIEILEKMGDNIF